MYDNLYESLSYNIPNLELSNEEKQFIVKNSSNLETEQKEIIYLLILYHYNKENPTSKTILPFKMQQHDTYLEIKLDALDRKLKQVLYKFIKQIFPNEKLEILDDTVKSEKKRRGRKPKYVNNIILQNIIARDLYKKVKTHNKENNGIVEFHNKKNISKQEEETKILDFNFQKNNGVYLENNVIRQIQLIDHITFGCLPGQTDIRCWYDNHEFTTSPIGIPIEYVPKKDCIKECTPNADAVEQDFFFTYGIFCSFSCALSYLEQHQHESIFKDSKSLLYSLYYKMYGTSLKAEKAPHWQLLKNYGGTLNIQQFREQHCNSSFIITDNIYRPYMLAVGKYIEEKKCGCL